MTPSPPRAQGRKIARGALLFGALGPAIGFGVLLVFGFVSMVLQGDNPFAEPDALWGLGVFVIFGLPSAYLIGTIPAAVTGLVAGRLVGRHVGVSAGERRHPASDVRVMAGIVLVGAIASAITGALIGGAQSALLLSGIGAISAVLVARIFRNRLRAPSDPSTPGA